MRSRETLQLDQRGRTYLTKLGFEEGGTLVADPIEGEDAWVLRRGRIVTEVELQILANPDNVAALERAAAESLAGEEGTRLR